MRVVYLLLLAALGLAGQTIPEPVLIDLGDNHFTICSDKTASGGIVNMRVTRSDDATWTAAEWEQCHSSASGGCTTNIFALNDASPRACVYSTDLTEGTAYLVHVNFWNGSAWTSDTDSTYQTNIQASSVCAAYPSNCTDIDADGGGGGTDRILQITTTSDGVIDTPGLPIHGRTWSALGTIDTETEPTVSTGECLDFQATLESAVTAYNAAGAQTHAVKIPTGVLCRAEHETQTFDTEMDVDGGTEQITLTAHGFSTGARVLYSKAGGSEAIGLTDATYYYVDVVDTDTISLAATWAEAIAGTPLIDLTASGGGSGETHRIRGYLTSYSVPDLTNTAGEFVIYSESADTDVDPPDGGLIAEDSGVGGLAFNRTLASNTALLALEGSGQQNLRLKNIVLQRPAARLTDFPEIALTTWTGANIPVITMAESPVADQWGTEFSVYFSAASTLRLRTGNKNGGNEQGAADWSRTTSTTYTPVRAHGSDEPGTPGAGVASKDVTREFTSATAAEEPVLTFSSNLNYASGVQYALTGISSGVITASGGSHVYEFGTGAERLGILVAGATGTGGTTDDECNTVHIVDGHDETSGTWDITDSGITCTGGTAEIPIKVWLHDLSGYTYESMSCLATVVTQTTAKLHWCRVSDSVNFVPDFTGLTVTGYMAFNFYESPPLLDLASATGVTIETVLFDSGAPPWLTLYAIDGALNLDDLIIIGSRFVGGGHYQPVDAIAGGSNLQVKANSNNHFQVFKCRACTDVQMINNLVETDQSIFLTADDATITQPSDITISSLIYNPPARVFSNNTASGGMWSPARQQPFEFKNGGSNILLEGVAVGNQKVSTTSSTAVFLCQTQLVNSSVLDYISKCSDITFRNNLIRGAMAFSVLRVAPGNAAAQYTVHGPHLIDNNIIFPTLIYNKPTGDYGQNDTFADFFTPNGIIVGRSRDVTISNNTFAWQATQINKVRDYNVFMDIRSLRTSAFTNTGNLYVDMDASSNNQNHMTLPTSWSWTNYEATSLADGVFSTLGTHSGNRTVACTIAPTTVDFDSANAAHTEAQGRLTAAGGSMSANWPVTPLSADSQSCNTRLDEVLTPGTWDPSGSEGADIDDILNAIGQTRGVAVTNVTRTSADISITPYSASAVCDLNYKAGPVSSFSSQTGVTQITSSSGSPRTFNLTGLAENTIFDVMIQCDRGERVYVSFETE